MQRSSAQDASPEEQTDFDKSRCNSRGQRETGFEVIFKTAASEQTYGFVWK